MLTVKIAHNKEIATQLEILKNVLSQRGYLVQETRRCFVIEFHKDLVTPDVILRTIERRTDFTGIEEERKMTGNDRTVYIRIVSNISEDGIDLSQQAAKASTLF